ncbi:septum formation family protein [Pseudactinotalea sp. Z1732]|uniref:septum formation family protein n=1 Tax=Pseudactinotalea sp. Z1732 TaxID=3413026 RepID=UPI003C7A622E
MRARRGPLLAALATVAMLAGALAGCSTESVQVGACAQWDQLQEAPRAGVEVVDCEQEHSAQFVGTFEVDFETFPGQEAIDDVAEPGCLEAFTEFVGIDYADSQLRLDWFRPTQESWQNTGGRDVWCVAYLPEGTTTGGFQDSGR